MKQFLYIIGFIIATLLFVDNEEQQAFLSDFRPKSETIMKEILEKNREQCMVVLSEDLKNGNLQTPRRVFQSSSSHFNVRIFTHTEKQIQYFKLKGCELLSKLSEVKAIAYYNNFTAIWRNKGLHVFALRKLLI